MQRRTVVWMVVLAWLVPAIGMGLALGLAPDVVVRKADAGAFLSAEARPGGYWASSVQTVQTTRGTLMVSGLFTALRGQPLVIVDSTDNGIQVCGKVAAGACVDLVGCYIGTLRPVPHGPVWLTFAQRQGLEILLMYWVVLGLAMSVLALVAYAGGCEADDDADGDARS